MYTVTSHLSTPFLTGFHRTEAGWRKLGKTMAKPAVRVPQFAAFIREQRAGRPFQQIVNRMKAVNVHVGHTALWKLEDEARVPSLYVLRGLSYAYGVSFEALAGRVLDELGAASVAWSKAAPQDRDLPAPIDAQDDATVAARLETVREKVHQLLAAAIDIEAELGGDAPSSDAIQRTRRQAQVARPRPSPRAPRYRKRR